VLACALKCENLYRVSWLTLKRRLLPLTEPEADELRRASRRDRSVARWFSLLYLVGMLGMAWFMLHFGLPAGAGVVYWTIRNVMSLSIGTAAFWESLALAILIVTETLAPIPLAVRERRLRRAGVLS
jgi:putative peptide zinc metalloprotease protein